MPIISITQVEDALTRVLTTAPAALGHLSGFTVRTSKVTPEVFVRGLTLGWLDNPNATTDELCAHFAGLGVPLSGSGLSQRFTQAGADLLLGVVQSAAEQIVLGDPTVLAVLERFAAVVLVDSTQVGLPDALATLWPGCGGRTAHGGQAGIKVQVAVDLVTHGLFAVCLEPARASDRASAVQDLTLPPGSLRIADLGYLKLAVLQQIGAAGSYWLTRARADAVIWIAGRKHRLATFLASHAAEPLDLAIELGAAERLAGRLVAVPAPADVRAQRIARLHETARRKGTVVSADQLALAGWTVYVTNLPVTLANLADVLLLGRVRWQIELLFKLWKSVGQLDASRGHTPLRVLCETLAKLLVQLLRHWLLLASGGWGLDRNMTAAARVVQSAALLVAAVFRGRLTWDDVFTHLQAMLAACQGTTSRQHPRLVQLLTDGETRAHQA